MPSRPLRPCGKIGCRKLTTDRYCDEHAHLADRHRKERHKQYDRHQRDQQAAKFYHSVEWERVRQAVIIRDKGLCQHCLLKQRITMADMVHHRFPVKTHWHLRLVMSNLVSLCNSCHAKIDHSKLGGL